MSDASDGTGVGTAADARPTRARDPYWLVLAARALVAVVVGLILTFSSDHSAGVGHSAFGGLAIASGVVVAIGAVAVQSGIERTLFVVIGVLGVALGLVSLLTTASGVPFFFFVVSAWAVITGFLELYLGIRARRRRQAIARDWIFAGGLTVLLAIVVLLIPADYSLTFTGPDNVTRTLTALIVAVGAIGAYAAVLGVYLVIAALSVRWATTTALEEAH